VIEIEHLTKIYPSGTKAIDDLNLTIVNGMLGLVGPNGAGKTTLMRILATLLRPTSGQVRIFGYPLGRPAGQTAVRGLLGYLPQEAGYHEKLTVEQELDYMALLKGIAQSGKRKQALERAVEQAGLQAARKERVRALSGGMKRRLGIGIALLGEPRLIIVDEPTAGLDPAERAHFRQTLLELAGDRVVILSTHIIEDVSQACQDLAVLCNGKLAYRGTPSSLIQKAHANISKPTLEAAYLWLVR
jgi:ABC-2 type transport system ATP-binding protein